VDEARTSVTGWVHRGRERVDSLRDAVDLRVDQARTAVQDGKTAAVQARGELRRRVEEAKASYRGGQRGEAPPSGPRLAPSNPSLAPASSVPAGLAGGSVADPDRVTMDGEPVPAWLTLMDSDDPPARRRTGNDAESGSMVVQEVVITGVSTETDAGDLAGGTDDAR
jgi:hypothetical protein